MPRAPLALAVLASTCVGLAQEPRPSAAATLHLVRELTVDGDEVTSLCWSPNGSLLAVGGYEGAVAVLDERGRRRCGMEVSDDPITGMCFSPDGRRLAVISRNLTVWDTANGKRIGVAEARPETTVDWSRDGRFLAVPRHDQRIVLLDPVDLHDLRNFEFPAAKDVSKPRFSATGDRIAFLVDDRATVFDTVTGQTVDHESNAAGGPIADLAWTDADRLELLRAGCAQRLLGDEVWIPYWSRASFALQPDGSRCAIWSGTTGLVLRKNRDAIDVPASTAIALHPDGHRWASAARDERRTIRVYRDEQESWDVDPHLRGLVRAALSGDGQFVFLRGEDVVCDTETGVRTAVSGLPSTEGLATDPNGPGFVIRVPHGTERSHVESWVVDFAPGATTARSLPTGNGPVENTPSRGSPCVVRTRTGVYSCTPEGPLSCMSSSSDARTWLLQRDGITRQRLERVVLVDLQASPDGTRLASTGDCIRILGTPSLATDATMAQGDGDGHSEAVRWIDDGHLVVARRRPTFLRSQPRFPKLQIVDVAARTVIASIDLPDIVLHLDVNRERRLVLAVLQHRALLFRYTLPPHADRRR